MPGSAGEASTRSKNGPIRAGSADPYGIELLLAGPPELNCPPPIDKISRSATLSGVAPSAIDMVSTRPSKSWLAWMYNLAGLYPAEVTVTVWVSFALNSAELPVVPAKTFTVPAVRLEMVNTIV